MEKVNLNLFIKYKGDDMIIVQIYVDDILFGATNELLCKDFENVYIVNLNEHDEGVSNLS